MVTIPKTMDFSKGMKWLDMVPTGYDWNYVNELIITLRENGRKTYLTSQIPVDMYYLLFFGLSYCLICAYFLKKLEKLSTSFIYLYLLPIIVGITDYLENFEKIKILNNSAGGQVLHRFALIPPNSKADRILALNASS